jgi:GNAT superfamily N-acetyltransferase
MMPRWAPIFSTNPVAGAEALPIALLPQSLCDREPSWQLTIGKISFHSQVSALLLFHSNKQGKLLVSKQLSIRRGVAKDAAALAALHMAVAGHLTDVHGNGPWSSPTSEKGVLFAMRNSRVLVAKQGSEIIATLRLATKKPWAIDTSYFTKCAKPLYLLAMAVTPARQRQGIGREFLQEAARIAAAMGADAIRLDAFDAAAGAGGFYERCGYAQRGRVTYRKAPLIYYELLL